MEELKLQIAEIEKEIKTLQDRREIMRYQLAAIQTTFKVGDRVTKDGGKTVYELSSIRPGYGSPDFYGYKIKKDGTPGGILRHIYVWNKEELKFA